MIRRPLLFGALATCALLVASVDARAAYSFTTGTVTANPPSFSGVTDTFTSINGSNPNDFGNNFNFVTINYSGLSSTPVAGTQTLSWVETLVSTTTGATGTFSIVGTLNVTSASNTGVPAATFSPTITPFGASNGAGFGLVFTGYTAGTFNPGAGTATANLAFNISAPTTVPEPASVAILGAGLVGVLGLGLRCRKKNLGDRPGNA